MRIRSMLICWPSFAAECSVQSSGTDAAISEHVKKRQGQVGDIQSIHSAFPLPARVIPRQYNIPPAITKNISM